jgi:hypothetical protein
MTEPIDHWRSEFEAALLENNGPDFLDRGEDGRYNSMPVSQLWQGFLIAKRSNPVLVLPDKYLDLDYDNNFYNFYMESKIIEALDKAGIAYRVEV